MVSRQVIARNPSPDGCDEDERPRTPTRAEMVLTPTTVVERSWGITRSGTQLREPGAHVSSPTAQRVADAHRASEAATALRNLFDEVADGIRAYPPEAAAGEPSSGAHLPRTHERLVAQGPGAEAVDRRGIRVGDATLIRSCLPCGPEMSSSRAALAIWSNGTRTEVSGVGRWLTIGMSL